jgi:predicted MFS family arabinose efflux permease
LIVPLLLALVAGTPVAVWTSHHLGWVYGALTLVSMISFVPGWRSMGKRKRSQLAPLPRPEMPDLSSVFEGENVHAEYAE